MITVKLKNKFQVPSRWDDFTVEYSQQFITLCCAMDDFERGIYTFDQFKLMTAFSLLSLDIEKIRKPDDIFYENAYRISNLLEFPYEITDEPDGSRTASIHISLFRNLLPQLGGRKGYTLNVSSAGLVDCDLTAEQYVDALALTDLYTRTRNAEALRTLTKTLYGDFEGITEAEMTAVYYNFRGVLEWIRNLPQYGIIFRHNSRKGESSPLGLSSSIFTLSKSGYGTLKEIKTLDVFSYLGVLVQMSIDSIHQMAQYKMSRSEISEKTNIPLEYVIQYTTDSPDLS